MKTELFRFMLYFLLAGSAQLLMTTNSLPLPAKEISSTAPLDDNSAATDCRCNSTKLKINGNFLFKWLNPSNGESIISTITMAADYLKILTDNKEVGANNSYICRLLA